MQKSTDQEKIEKIIESYRITQYHTGQKIEFRQFLIDSRHLDHITKYEFNLCWNIEA